jgi:hypothetical protein
MLRSGWKKHPGREWVSVWPYLLGTNIGVAKKNMKGCIHVGAALAVSSRRWCQCSKTTTDDLGLQGGWWSKTRCLRRVLAFSFLPTNISKSKLQIALNFGTGSTFTVLFGSLNLVAPCYNPLSHPLINFAECCSCFHKRTHTSLQHIKTPMQQRKSFKK